MIKNGKAVLPTSNGKLLKIIYLKTTLSNFCATGKDKKDFSGLKKILCHEFQENKEISNETDITADYNIVLYSFIILYYYYIII